MRITIGQFFKPTVTVQYPHQTLKIPPRFRGHIELVLRPGNRQSPVFRLQAVRTRLPQRLHHRRGRQARRRQEEIRNGLPARFHQMQPVRLVRRGLPGRRHPVLARIQPRQHEQGRICHGPVQTPGGGSAASEARTLRGHARSPSRGQPVARTAGTASPERRLTMNPLFPATNLIRYRRSSALCLRHARCRGADCRAKLAADSQRLRAGHLQPRPRRALLFPPQPLPGPDGDI